MILLLCVCLPLVVSDCYDEPPNSETYNNCGSCYQTFANALVNTADNKYILSRAFFPINNAPSVQVEITYRSNGTGRSLRYFWVMGGFFIFQPLDLFLYRSLFFSLPTYRKKAINVTLPHQCFGSDDSFFEYTTQRVSLQKV